MNDLETLEHMGCKVKTIFRHGCWHATALGRNINPHFDAGDIVVSVSMEKTKSDAINVLFINVKTTLFKFVCFIESNDRGVFNG